MGELAGEWAYCAYFSILIFYHTAGGQSMKRGGGKGEKNKEGERGRRKEGAAPPQAELRPVAGGLQKSRKKGKPPTQPPERYAEGEKRSGSLL